MAAPAHTTRTAPTGFKIPEGYRSYIAISGDNEIAFWERDVKPPSIDGGDPINTTTQWNVKFETFFPRHLIKLDSISVVAAYDPDVFADILANINVNQAMTFYWPDGSYVDFYGWIQKFEFGELKIGDFPTATVTIALSNTDPATSLEQGPVFHAAAGT